MVVEAAVLVVREEECRRSPHRTRQQAVQDVGDELLPHLDVRDRMLVVLGLRGSDEDGVDERHVRQRARGKVGVVLREGEHANAGAILHIAEKQGSVRGWIV